MPPYVSLVLPAYNERAVIRTTLQRTIDFFELRGISYEIIVAADGDDGTREVARRMGHPAIRVIGGPERRGKGRGVREAVAIAAGEIVGYADADYKVPIEEFERLQPWLKQGWPVVTGSRKLDASLIERTQPLYRRLGSCGFGMVMRAATGLWDITDSQCGFKFFHAPVAKDLFARQRIDGYMFDVEILALARVRGYRVKEVAVRWRDDGDSRLELVRGNLRNMRDIWRIRRSLAGAAR